MLEAGAFAATFPDALRMIAIPVFIWAAWSDLKTRRISNRLWPPLIAIAVVALALEGVDAFLAGGIVWRDFLIVTILSIGFLVPLAYGFWYLGGFGGADAKAIMVLAILFPSVPRYDLLDWVLPVTEPITGVFSLSILTNAVVIGLLYPVTLALYNAASGEYGWTMFVGRRIPVASTASVPGRLLESPDGVDLSGLDLDALRMYLNWRGCTLDELRADPDRYRHQVPDDPGDPGDGAIADGGSTDDRWGAEAFLEAVDGSAYGTTPDLLRDGLDVLVERERVWYSPGIPFIVLIAAGLMIAVIYGDVFLNLLEWIGVG